MMNSPPPPPPEDDADRDSSVEPHEAAVAATKKPWSRPTFVVLEDRTLSRVGSGPIPFPAQPEGAVYSSPS